MGTNANAKWNDPALLDAMRKALVTGETDESVGARFGVNGTTAARARIFVQGEASGGGQVRGAVPGRTRSFNGKTNPMRQRELKSRRTTDNYLELLKVQLLISQLCSVLEGVDISTYGIDEVSLWRVNDIHDDLLSLATWADLTLGKVQGWLGDADVRRKITMLRDSTGRNAEEAKAYAKLADKLQRKLDQRMIAG